MSTPEILVQDGTFHLSNDRISYIMELGSDQWLQHRYWGPRLDSYHGANRLPDIKRTFAAPVSSEEPLFSLDMAPQEFSCPHQGDYRIPSLVLRHEDGLPAGRFRYLKHEITENVHLPEGMPHIRPSEDKVARTLSIHFRDTASDALLILHYTITAGSAALIRSSEIINGGTSPLYIEQAMSALIDMPYSGEQLVTFHGSHQKEFQLDRHEIAPGITAVGSTRGASSPQHPPFAAVCAPETTEYSGEVRAFQLIYSGNHSLQAERDQYDSLRIVTGIHPQDFRWKLMPGEHFQTPQAVFVYSDEGFNGMSQELHRLWKERLFPRQWAERQRPVLLNSWEMCYFDVTEKKMLQVIEEAASLGFELVVLDDGWFGHRNDSRSSLGDWSVDREKFPGGLQPLVKAAQDRGMQLGIWFEPEMISPDSNLMRAHPDWAAHFPNVEPLLGRNQLVLDLTRRDIQDYVLETLSNFLSAYPITYVKWDMNRHMTDPWSPELAPDRGGEFFHRYMLGLYRVLEELTARFPDVLFENCSSGGGRFDAGMSFYMPQTWTSDNTDALDRQTIQYGASFLFPPSAIGAHVSAVPNHQTGRNVPFQTRAAVASSANMGYELDVLSLTPEEKEQVRTHILEYKGERDLILHGDFYRLRNPESGTGAWMLTDRNRVKAIVYAFQTAYDCAGRGTLLKIPYLESHRIYRDITTGRQFSGEELRRAGLAFRFPQGDYPSAKIVLEAT